MQRMGALRGGGPWGEEGRWEMGTVRGSLGGVAEAGGVISTPPTPPRPP